MRPDAMSQPLPEVERTAGDIVDQLGTILAIEDTDLPASVLVIATVFRDDERQPRLVIGTSDGMSWVEQAGLLSLAAALTKAEYTREDDDE